MIWKWSGTSVAEGICKLVLTFHKLSNEIGDTGLVKSVLFEQPTVSHPNPLSASNQNALSSSSTSTSSSSSTSTSSTTNTSSTTTTTTTPSAAAGNSSTNVRHSFHHRTPSSTGSSSTAKRIKSAPTTPPIRLSCEKNDKFTVSVFYEQADKEKEVKEFLQAILSEFSNKYASQLASLRPLLNEMSEFPEKCQTKPEEIIIKFKDFGQTCDKIFTINMKKPDRHFKKEPEVTSIGRNNRHRKQWLEIMVQQKKDILAIQTLRNHVMSSTLLATASITLVVLILNIIVSGNLTKVLDSMRIVGASNSEILVYKAFVLILIYLFSFLSMVTCIRYQTHLAYLINVAPFHPECSLDYCNNIMLAGSHHYTLGVRAFYCSLSVILWFFDPIFLLICTIMLIAWLYLGDISDSVIPRQEKKEYKMKRKSRDRDMEMGEQQDHDIEQ
ncbi:hypothetical protein DFA_04826 [Cavenderia fasciculata]|uniref:DUF599 family protein n=1 Tax=Cavenderia fasciculata TaxID=261658 RepID=F4PLU0_CACFS|nr:uncharacterized protein DFA_04826 [Cavenderia fasciculata]EGG22696.1 hypothetical protein DFA_04826 [Cavenderia fasciculata]|eukprot:XP_004360547.1 hypothetical protein DFA_04826 [Cavenderia fasciculata]